MSKTTTNTNERDAIERAIQPYLDGARSGKGDDMKPAFSARYCRIAPDSNRFMGLFPSTGFQSVMAGIFWFGKRCEKAFPKCTPWLILTGVMEYSRPDSSKKIKALVVN